MKRFLFFLLMLTAWPAFSNDGDDQFNTLFYINESSQRALGEIISNDTVVKRDDFGWRAFKQTTIRMGLPDSISVADDISGLEATTAFKNYGSMVCFKVSRKKEVSHSGLFLLKKKTNISYGEGVVCNREKAKDDGISDIARIKHEKINEEYFSTDIILLLSLILAIMTAILAGLSCSLPDLDKITTNEEKSRPKKQIIKGAYFYLNLFFGIMIAITAMLTLSVSQGWCSFPPPSNLVYILALLNLGFILGTGAFSLSYIGSSADNITSWLIFIALSQFAVSFFLITENLLATVIYLVLLFVTAVIANRIFTAIKKQVKKKRE